MICGYCKKDLPEDNFHLNKYTSTGRHTYCKACRKKLYPYSKYSHSAYPKGHSLQYYWRKYHITADQYRKLYEIQKGRCSICGAPDIVEPLSTLILKTRRLSIDHNHITGKVRGLLCHNCNIGIAFLGGDSGTIFLKKAIKYLNSPPFETLL